MKTFLFLVVALAFCTVTWAQDSTVAAPSNYKKVMENDRVRVLHVTVKAGEKIPAHSHPDHVAYGLSSCTLTMTGPDGKAAPVALKEGEALWLDATTHSAVNNGTADCHVLVVELKDAKAK